MNDLQQLMLISAASRTADAHAEKQSRMIKEQSRSADAAEASKREIAKRAELEQQRYDEERARRGGASYSARSESRAAQPRCEHREGERVR